MFNFISLQYFQVVAETQNYTKAAEILNVSQPTLSYAIKSLESYMGCKLFNQKGRGVELNMYGKILLEYVTEAIDIIEKGEVRIRRITSPETGIVRVSCLYSMGANLLPFIIKDYKKEYPKSTIILSQFATRTQLEMLYKDELDLCFVTEYDGIGKNPNLERKTVLNENLYVLVNRNHPLAAKDEVKLEELDGEDFISYSDMTYFKQELNSIFKKLNIKPNVIFETNEDGSVAGLVAAGLGLAVVPPVFNVNFEVCKPLRISYPVCTRTLCMAWRETAYSRPAVINFRDYVVKWLSEHKEIHFASQYK